MGPGRLTAAVADAGLLIHLAEIGALSLLRVCDSLAVPRAVWEETVERGRVGESALLAAAVVHVTDVLDDSVASFVAERGLDSLHRGEQQCLFLCASGGIPVLLTDDLAARDAAKRIGLTPAGSLGVVVRAYRLGDLTLTEAEARIQELQRVSSLFVTGRIVDLILEELRRTEP